MYKNNANLHFIHVKITKQQYVQLMEKRNEIGLSISAQIRIALKKYLEGRL